MLKKTLFTASIVLIAATISIQRPLPGNCGSTENLASFPSLLSSIRIDSPLDLCGEPVPLDEPEVLERIEKELLLSVWDRAQVILWYKRANRYFPYIESMLKKHHLPDDLKYVAVIESAMLPHIGSSKGAVGYWQFIPSTGKKYGLRIDSDIDERRNIYTSTDAAIRYFEKLYGDFDSWTLSAAAYNMGENGLKAQIKRQETNDYYHLYLSLETQRYVPRILSAKIILSNPEKFGFQFLKEDLYPPMEFERIRIQCTEGTPILLIAKAAGTYFKTIKDLNPQIRGNDLPAGVHTLFIPKGSGKYFQPRYNEFYKAWKKEVESRKSQAKRYVHVVKSGENLTAIAKRYGVPLSSLIRWNRLNPKKPIHPGSKLVIYKTNR